MLASASSACVRPSSQNANAKVRNRESCVRFQKRRKNRPATRNPKVTAPERNSNRIIFSLCLQIPDESEQQDGHRGEREQQPDDRKVDRGYHQQVEHHDRIVCGQEAEAQGAPQQQTCAAAPVATRQQAGAGRARRKAEQIDRSRKQLLHAQSFLSLKASAKAVRLPLVAAMIARRTASGLRA